jgi:hypothetical protein
VRRHRRHDEGHARSMPPRSPCEKSMVGNRPCCSRDRVVHKAGSPNTAGWRCCSEEGLGSWAYRAYSASGRSPSIAGQASGSAWAGQSRMTVCNAFRTGLPTAHSGFENPVASSWQATSISCATRNLINAATYGAPVPTARRRLRCTDRIACVCKRWRERLQCDRRPSSVGLSWRLFAGYRLEGCPA